jgi:hypothetical protein
MESFVELLMLKKEDRRKNEYVTPAIVTSNNMKHDKYDTV